MALKGYSAVLPLLTFGLVLVSVSAMPELNPDHDLRIWMDRMEKRLELSLKQSGKVENENRDLKIEMLNLKNEFSMQQTRFTNENHALKSTVRRLEEKMEQLKEKLTRPKEKFKGESKDVTDLFTAKYQTNMKTEDNRKAKAADSRMVKEVISLKTKLVELEQELAKQKERLAEQEKDIKRLSSKKLRKQKQINHNHYSKFSPELQNKGFENIKAKRNDDLGALEPVVAGISQTLEQMTADMQAFKNQATADIQAIKDQATARPTGTTFVRWGNGQCPNTSEIVYSGTAGGGWYTNYGSAANFLCLPHHPTFDPQDKTLNDVAGLWGAEYQTHPEPSYDMTPLCAVCRASRASTVMVPATHSCEAGWTLEYSGYLMTGHGNHQSASEYICVDRALAPMEGSKANYDGKLLYYTTARCGSLSCPPYVEGRLIRCALCSK